MIKNDYDRKQQILRSLLGVDACICVYIREGKLNIPSGNFLSWATIFRRELKIP